MKFFIVGLHGSGKQEIVEYLKKLGVKCGRLFSDIDEPDARFYGSYDYELFTTKDVNEIFENNAYIFIQRITREGKCFYEGLSSYEFEHNDVFVLSPDQLTVTSFTSISEPYCFVWIDNTKTDRYARYRVEQRGYDFYQREEQETKDLGYFVSLIYDSEVPILYFKNEDPGRISSVIYSAVKYPDLLDVYKKTFNN